MTVSRKSKIVIRELKVDMVIRISRDMSNVDCRYHLLLPGHYTRAAVAAAVAVAVAVLLLVVLPVAVLLLAAA
jgi:hypothetical protein